MLDSQKIPGPRNEDYGRGQKPSFHCKQYTKAHANLLEMVHCSPHLFTFPEGSPVVATVGWAKMAKDEGHRVSTPRRQSKEAAAEAGRKSGGHIRQDIIDEIAKVIPTFNGHIFHARDIAARVDISTARAGYFLTKMASQGLLNRSLEKTCKGYQYSVK